VDSNTAMCAEHEDRAALGVCARCGTYLCAACGYSVSGQTICIRCHARLATDPGKLRNLRTVGILFIVSAVLSSIGGAALLAAAVYRFTDGLDIFTAEIAMDVALLGGFALWILLTAIAQFAGARAILKRRRRWIVFVAIGATMLVSLLTGLIGFLGIGLSIWALILIMDHRVAAAFDQPPDVPS
jgi:hypothetical protein